MLELTPSERRALRARAHHLDPVVSIGQHGLTPPVMQEIDRALAAHGLIKVRVHSDDRGLREAMLAQIADELSAASVQHLGKLLVLWRPLPEKDAKPAKKPATRPRKTAKAAGAPPRRTPREDRGFEPVARRARKGTAGDETAGAKPASSARGQPRSAAKARDARGDARSGERRRDRAAPPPPPAGFATRRRRRRA